MEHLIISMRRVLGKKLTLRVPHLHDSHHIVHWMHTHLHTAYFGAVWYEAHGMYGYAAGALFVLSVAGAFLGEEVA